MMRVPHRLVRLLTWKRARNYALPLLALYVAAWTNVLVLGDPPLNSSGTPIGGDYIAFHSAGRLVASGRAAEMYDHAAIAGAENALLGGRAPAFYDAYRNPPFYAVLHAPLAQLDLLPGFALFALLSALGIALAVWLLVQEAPFLRNRWRGLVILVLAFPPVYFGLIDGQNAIVSLLLYALIYRSLTRHQDGFAGVWAALGLFKPQLFFVFPLIFVASRRWRALVSYIAVAGALFFVSLILVGVDGLQAWLRILIEPESGNSTANAWRMASLKSFFDSLISGHSPLPLALYAVASVVLLVALVGVWARPITALPVAWAFTSLVAVLVDPHLVDYDLSVLVVAGVVAGAQLRPVLWLLVPLYLISLFRTEIQLGDLAIQLTPVLLACCTVVVFRQIRPKEQPAASVVDRAPVAVLAARN